LRGVEPMRNHTLEAEMAARAKLTVAMMEFDAHIETFAKATQGFRSQFLIMTLSLRAIEAAVRRHTRDEVAEYSKLVAAELGISHDVTDAFVNFQIAMTECGMGGVRA
jgi:hypothetical protein